MTTTSRILIVDDNADAADSLAMLLELYGHAVKVATDGVQALAVGEAFQPQVVLLDIGLPGMDGYEVCRRMRGTAWGREALLAAVTGWGSEGDPRGREAGFDAHLVKPVEPQALQDLVARVGQATP